MTTYLNRVLHRTVPQSEPLDTRQVKNNAGGYVYAIAPAEQVRRFIVLGTEGGTYYADEVTLTKENTSLVQNFAKDHSRELVDMVVEISSEGRAAKQSPGLFALAVAASVPESAKDRQYALDVLPKVARTASSLFEFVSYVTQFRGWGNALKRAVAQWYTTPPAEWLGHQGAKYRNRHGYTHRDLLRLSHPVAPSQSHQSLFGALVGKDVDSDTPQSYKAFVEAQSATVRRESVKKGTSWEFYPTEFHNFGWFWETLLDNDDMPVNAVLRNLPRFSALGIDNHPRIVEKLNIGGKFIHPVNVAVASKVYNSGSNRNLQWTPNRHISYALDNLTLAAFKNVQPTDKKILIAVDVSYSMQSSGWNRASASNGLTPAEMATITTLGLLNASPNSVVVGFADTLQPLRLKKESSIENAWDSMRKLNFGATDCSLPMLKAAQFGGGFDAFVVLTDNETWSGSVHPMEALNKYRSTSGVKDAKLAVAAFASTGFSIADPNDGNTMDVVGTDSAIPKLMSDFVAGRL